MNKIYLGLLSVILGLSSCSNTITEETAENFKQVELPDSSVVYLNHNSKLTYNNAFNPRRVTLEGEAFFSVNNGDTPFIIKTKEGDEVTVEGTEFNLIASKNFLAIEVEIGKVSLHFSSGKVHRGLGRGQRLDYGRHDNGLHLGHAKHKHRSWISVMDNDFRKSGKVLKRSQKHSVKNSSKGKSGGFNKLFKGKGDKSANSKNDIKGGKSKSGSKVFSKESKGSKGVSDKGNAKNDKRKN